jgi:hypothetical protein
VSIHDTEISDHQGSGVTVLNEGSSATIVHSAVTDAPAPVDRRDRVRGGRVTRSTFSGNDCREPDPDCGRFLQRDRACGHRCAASADTKAVLDGVRIKRTSGAPVRTFECCGFTAEATVRP